MPNNSRDDQSAPRGERDELENRSESNKQSSRLSHLIQSLVHLGLGELLLRVATNVLSIAAIVIVIWLVQLYLRPPGAKAQPDGQESGSATPQPAPALSSVIPLDLSSIGIVREADIHTNIPSRPRQEMVKYTVQAGDTVSGIADKYGLQPKTIFAANYPILEDDPESLRPKQILQILPVDGVYWQWLGGSVTFAQWAAYFKVKPEDILNYPANAAAVGNPQNPTIKTGSYLVIPGGEYQYHTPGQMPLGITRSNPASAQVGGAGACHAVTGGAVGTGTFVYPTSRHYLSGYDYSVKTNHLAIDLAANLGDPIYAADGGVIVYAGENSYGYGNMIMIDHGTGFQTLYAHLSVIFVSCGQNVTQGETIGSAGATGHASGPHLHFEVRTASTVIDPWDVLPPP